MSKKHFWRASAEVVGFNTGLWAFDRFIQHGDFSYISFNTIKENFREGFKWDNDKLGTNTFLHPYNGSLYFNAGRSNGFNFWQSELFAIAGSGMWELFMECEYPSTNDFIATPIGGAALGEILFRASDAVLDDRLTGGPRAGREIACFILSPMRGINRIVTGDAWKVRPTRGRLFGQPNFALRASIGYRALQYNGHFRDIHQGLGMQIDAEYGDRFEVKSTSPYDYFTFKAQLQMMKTQPFLSQIELKGRLLARELFDNYGSKGSLGLYQHFDFYDSDTIGTLRKVPFKLGIPASVGAGFMFRDVDRKTHVFDCFAHANIVALGSILSDHYTTDERNYNWATGFSLKAGVNLVMRKNRLSISASHNYYRLFTLKGYDYGTDLRIVNFRKLNVMGDKSVASLNMTEARLDWRIWRRFYATLLFTNYVRSSHYRDFDHVKTYSSSLSLMASYKF
ncbi:MAG: DUF3943 domain-containing protein [Muribaculaceae bacterium]|nr:DUF3943 domain-containing protein [Muribaculaceae bacterium]MDE6755178.1 DUF3943 domain-containing protein [Muribaculaceae bacterium]